MSEKLDAIIFGATGYTGRVVVESALEILKDFKWGIAGRNESKLQDVLRDIGIKVNQDLSHIPIILADVYNRTSIDNMVQKCKLVLNCCGPFSIYGENVVRSCVYHCTHHIDISCEPQYMSRIQMKYDLMAEHKGVYIISACGFECIAAEMGILYAESNFRGFIKSIDLYTQPNFNYQDTSSKALFSTGTWNSAVNAMQYHHEKFSFEDEYNRGILHKIKPKGWFKPFLHRTYGLDGCFIQLPDTDSDVVYATQCLRYLRQDKTPIQFKNYWGFDFTRNLLLEYPSIFSYGLVSADGPLEVNRKAMEFSMTFKARGWSWNCLQYIPPHKEVVVEISGTDPIYGVTSSALLCCAKIILSENNNMPICGGVYTPGMAFANTTLIDELSRCGLKFKVKRKEMYRNLF